MYKVKSIESPEIIKNFFNSVEKECVIVDVSGEEYDICEQCSYGNKYWANSKPGVYGAGLGRTIGDEYRPARTGLLGQMAFAKLTNEPFDNDYRHGGDKQDNLLFGKYKVDVKCAMKNRGEGLIYHINEWGRKIPLDKHIYVCGYIESEDRINKKSKVVIVGFAFKNDIEKCEIKYGKGNGHKNYVIPYANLNSITKFLRLKKEMDLKYNTSLYALI